MTVHLYAAFVAAVTLLMLIPGPNVALITASSIAHGRRYGLATVAGTCAAMPFQLGLVLIGMNGVLRLAGQGFTLLRWAGVVYLVWLGWRAWRSPPNALAGARLDGASALTMVARGFVTSLLNPKTLIFYAAFLPQFVIGADPGQQMALLAVTMVAVTAAVDSGWALLAARLSAIATRWGQWRGRLTGALLIAAGVGLAIARGGG